jgi:hypothetical protein
VPQGSDRPALPRRPPERFQLFISYSGENRAQIAPFVAQLEEDGFTVFFDHRQGMQPGGLMPQLADTLDASDHVVACLTPSYLRGKWPLYELGYSAHADPNGDRGRIIPVWFDRDGCEPLNYLRHIVHFDLSRHDPYGKAYANLRDAIRERLARPQPTPDRDAVAAAVAEVIAATDDPEVTLFRVRQAGRGLARQLYQDVLDAQPGRRTLEELADDLLRSGSLADEPATALGRLRAFGEQVRADDDVTQEAVEQAVDALGRLYRWMFPDRADPTISEPGASLAPVALDPGVRLPVQERVTRVAAELAWPVGDQEVLVWEGAGGLLRSYLGDEPCWRDDERVDVRRVDTAADGRLAIGGWEGRVRYFVGGPEPAATIEVDGAVGDLRCARGGLVVGSWKHALWRLSDDGSRVWLGPVPGGVHRIAISRHGERFAVVQLTGRVGVYDGNRSVGVVPASAEISDVAYAGTRLVLLTEEAVAGWRLDGSLSAPVPAPGAHRLLPVADRARCLMLSDARDQVLIGIDEDDRHVPELRLRPGETLLSADATGRRLVTRRGDDCVYRRDGAEVARWPGATAAAISGDGGRIAVCAGDRVVTYRDAP